MERHVNARNGTLLAFRQACCSRNLSSKLKSRVLKSYNFILSPIPDCRLWPHTGFGKILPPRYKSLPDRPKKVRRKGNYETQTQKRLVQSGYNVTFSKWDRVGHNSRKCNGTRAPTEVRSVLEPPSRGRPKISAGQMGHNSSKFDNPSTSGEVLLDNPSGDFVKRGIMRRRGRTQKTQIREMPTKSLSFR